MEVKLWILKYRSILRSEHERVQWVGKFILEIMELSTREFY